MTSRWKKLIVTENMWEIFAVTERRVMHRCLETKAHGHKMNIKIIIYLHQNEKMVSYVSTHHSQGLGRQGPSLIDHQESILHIWYILRAFHKNYYFLVMEYELNICHVLPLKVQYVTTTTTNIASVPCFVTWIFRFIPKDPFGFKYQ